MDKKDEMNPVLARLTDFANSKGGPSKIYNAIGKQVSTYWNLVKNDSKPSVDTLIQLADTFSDFDVNYILTGKSSSDKVKHLEYEVGVLNRMLDKQYKQAALLGKLKGAANSSKEVKLPSILVKPFYNGVPMSFDRLLVASTPQKIAFS